MQPPRCLARRRAACATRVLILVTCITSACARREASAPVPPAPAPPAAATPAPAARPPLTFTDVTAESGLDFVHDAGLDGSAFMPEIMGAGGAFLDADGDDDLDVLLLQGGAHGFPWREGNRARLFLQDAGRF